jgi:hypothetical protein
MRMVVAVIARVTDLARFGGFEPVRNPSPFRANDFFCDLDLTSQTRGYSSVSRLISSDAAGNRWVGAVPNGESASNLGRQKPKSLPAWLLQESGTTFNCRFS